MILWWLIPLGLFFVSQSHGAKILGVYPFPSRSHSIVQKALALELARRGHEVTILTAFPEKKPVANLTEIPIKLDLASSTAGQAPPNLFDMGSINIFQMSMMMLMMGGPFCELFLQEENVQKLIHSKNLNFDLVIIEAFTNDCVLGFAHKFNAPVVQVCTYGGTNYMADLVGSPNPYSYVPDEFLNLRDKMTFGERLFNTVVGFSRHIGRMLIHLPTQDKIMKKYFNDSDTYPDITEVEKRTSLVLLNSHFSISYPKPLTPNYVQVGGMHVKPPKKLPQDLQEYLDNAKEGAVYFSMGSNLNSSDMPETKRNAFLKAFSKLKQKVLWKWEMDSLPGQPKNVKLGKWLPQSDILAHPNIQLFITHGGLLSTQEAIDRGVPVVSIPVFADQFLNANKAVLSGYGARVDFSNVTEESVEWAINEVLGNSKYRENAKRISRIYRDQPLTPLQQAVFWTEYVIRHKGAPHMRSASLDLTWYQYFLLDVIAVLGLALLFVLLIPVLILKYLYKKFCKSGSSQTRESIKKKRN